MAQSLWFELFIMISALTTLVLMAALISTAAFNKNKVLKKEYVEKNNTELNNKK